MLPATVMSKNWKGIIRVDQNKPPELFCLLSREILCLPIADGKKINATCGTGVLCSPTKAHLTSLDMILHVVDVVPKGIKRVAIPTVDTDVVILVVASFNNINPGELWSALGTFPT